VFNQRIKGVLDSSISLITLLEKSRFQNSNQLEHVARDFAFGLDVLWSVLCSWSMLRGMEQSKAIVHHLAKSLISGQTASHSTLSVQQLDDLFW
jgi:hypothetical protein